MKSKKILSVILCFVMCFAISVPSFASNEGIMPLYTNAITVESVFNIDENGKANVSYSCFGYEGICTGIEVEVKIQKKVFFWWTDVDGAYWTDETSEVYYAGDHNIQLNSKGTYKATVVFTVYGVSGEPDVITNTMEKKY